MDVLFILNACSKLEISTRMKLTYPLMGETVAFIIIRGEFRSNTAKNATLRVYREKKLPHKGSATQDEIYNIQNTH